MSKFEADTMTTLAAPEIQPAHPTKQAKAKSYGNGLLLLVLAAILWGTVGVTSGIINRVQTTPAFTIGFLRLAFSSPFLLAIAFSTVRHNFFRLTKRDWLLVALMGSVTAAYQLLYFTAIPLASVTLVVVVALCSSPIIVAVLSIFVFKERLTKRLLVALALALFGTSLLAFGGNSNGDFFKPEYLLGALLALGAGFAYSSFVVLSKLTTQHSQLSAVQAMSLAFTIGALIMLPLAVFSGNLQLNLDWQVWAGTSYLGVVPTGIAYIIYMFGIRRATATSATITTLLEPAVAAFLSWLLLGETLSLLSLFGVIMLIGGVALLYSRRTQ